MIGIILTLIVGLCLAFFALQNTALATVHVASYTFAQVPLYLVIIVSFLLGIFIAWLISLVDFVSSAFKIFGKDRKISETKRTVASLQEKVRQLEIENAQLNERIKSASGPNTRI